MIIIGYQGIGKSTLAKGGNGFIDLESSNFWVDGKRSPDWAKVYANIAVHLSSQGYHVFTASHKLVRESLKTHPDISTASGIMPGTLAVCYPMLSLRDGWVAKLEQRYKDTGTDKNYKAWKNAEEMFFENIQDLSDEPLPIIHIPIANMDYNLEQELARASITKKGVGTVEPR